MIRVSEGNCVPEEDGEWDGEVAQDSLKEWSCSKWWRRKHHKDPIQSVKHTNQNQLPLREQKIVLDGDEGKDLLVFDSVDHHLEHE